MQSLRSRIYLFLLKHRHWLRLQRRPRAIDASTSVPALRQRADASSSRFGRVPSDVHVQPVTIAGCSAEWIVPAQAGRQGVLLYFHGGGYVMGSLQSHRSVIARIARECGVAALHFDYRLAPEHPFPAALNDAMAVHAALRAQGHAAASIVFMGDSAGGGLCLATLLALRDLGLPMPAGAVALSPWTDLTCSGPSYRRRDPLAPPGSWQTFARYYAAGTDPATPWISPLHAALDGLPPLLIHVGECESMLDDSVQFADRAAAAGVSVQLRTGRGMMHCYPLFAPRFPEAVAALRETAAFVRRVLAGDQEAGDGRCVVAPRSA
ncbi:MAG: alpha/beta hydrolase [Rhodanobacteraceae bacterium]